MDLVKGFCEPLYASGAKLSVRTMGGLNLIIILIIDHLVLTLQIVLKSPNLAK